mmetsp:Transcript_96163/g.310492  ORF Transcript_96163/g.310492 Transcript_96163/m.310492 type:complete len:97 (+) Transcript_96163:91-381(+)
MAAARGRFPIVALIVLAAVAWISIPAFVTPPAARVPQTEATMNAPNMMVAGAVAPLLLSQPAVADDGFGFQVTGWIVVAVVLYFFYLAITGTSAGK